MATTSNLGRVSLVPKGQFVLGTQYYRLDLVMDDGGNTYMAKADNKNVALTDENTWMKIVDVDAAKQDVSDLEDEVDQLKSAINDACDYLNWYNPFDNYKFVDSDGTTSRDSYVTKNADGSLTCTMSMSVVGHVIAVSQNTKKLLTAGTYNLSARITLNNNAPDAPRNVYIRTGIAGTTATSVRMKTERGGNTNIGNSDKVGWVMGNFTIADEQVFSFEIVVRDSTIANNNLPYVIDKIQITKSDSLLDYTEKNYEANDSVARLMVDNVLTELSKIDERIDNANNGFETFASHGTFEIGGLTQSGQLLPSQTTRVSNTDKMTFDRDITVKAKTGFRWGYIPFSGDTPQSWSGWIKSDKTVPAGTSFIVQISKDPEGTATANVDEYVNALTFATKVGESVETGAVGYFGELMPSKRGTFDYQKLFMMESATGIASQDIEVYGNYLFVAFSGTEQIRVYSLAGYSLIATVTADVNHGSQMQFSDEFYASGDPFPLLYVGGYTSNIINILRITNSNNTWAATTVKQLYIPTTNGYYLAPTLDNYNNVLYCFGNKIQTTSPVNNSNVIIKCDLSNLTDNGDGTYTPAIIQSKTIKWVGMFQGGKYYNGRLYIGFTNNSTPYNSRIAVIDPESGDIKTIIDMTAVTTSECEGLCYRITGSNILWLYTDYWNVYQLQFFA